MLLVGRHKAREMYFSGERVPAAELYRLGAVRDVVPAEELMQTVYEFAASSAKKPDRAAPRQRGDEPHRVPTAQRGIPHRAGLHGALLKFEDAKEANRAFLEKRDPDWKWQ